jgi:hypothetical protein
MEISRLRTELARETVERDILGKATTLLRNGSEVDCYFTQRHKRYWPTRGQCRVLAVGASGYQRSPVYRGPFDLAARQARLEVR